MARRSRRGPVLAMLMVLVLVLVLVPVLVWRSRAVSVPAQPNEC